MILILTYIIFIIWLSLTIKNKIKNLYNADLSKDVHMYMYIWMFILIILGVVKIIQYNSNIWILGLLLVVVKQYIILILRLILFRIYFEIKKIYNFEQRFSFQYIIADFFGHKILLKYFNLKKKLIEILKVTLPLLLFINNSTTLIILMIVVWMNLKSYMFSPLMDCASINMYYDEEIILNFAGKKKVSQYHNNLMHCKVVDYRKNDQGVWVNQDFIFK